MSGFVLLSGADSGPWPAWAEALAAKPPSGWRARRWAPRLLLLTSVATAVGVKVLGADLLLGWLAKPVATCELEALARDDFAPAARWLQSHTWGEYVYLRRAPDSGELAVYRDPGGALDAVTWRTGGLSVCASQAPPWIAPSLPPDLSVDWDAVAGFVVDPTVQTAGCGLSGLHALAPGEIWEHQAARQLWRPADHLPRRPARRRSRPEDLRAVVADAVDRMAEGRVLLEVSGGLDSAIVAGCLPPGRLAVALNYYVRDAEGDEREFARLVAAHAGPPLTEIEKPEARLDLDALRFSSGGFRPALNLFDQAHDLDVAARCEISRIDTLMTGQGGDDVFFQPPTPRIVADGFRHGLSIAELTGLARWQHRSVYGLLRDGAVTALRGPAVDVGRSSHLTDLGWAHAQRGRRHPWLEGLETAAPAKAMQAAGLANALIVKAPSRRGAAARLRHPLLSQPVMEYALGCSVPDLTRGRDRGLARQAFADLVPREIVQRPTKGRMSAHYGRVLAAALNGLRPLLLDGRLATRGVIDPAALDRRLTVESLIWRAGYGAIVNLLMVELWLRAWEGRIDEVRARGDR